MIERMMYSRSTKDYEDVEGDADKGEGIGKCNCGREKGRERTMHAGEKGGW